MAKLLMLYGGHKRYHLNGIEIVPIEEFVKNLKDFIKSGLYFD
jgi:hypothetical protein